MLCSIVTQIFGIPCEILTPFPNPVTSVLFSLKQIRDFAGREQPWGLALKAAPPLFFSITGAEPLHGLRSFRISSQKSARGDVAGATKPESRAAGC